MKYKVTYLSLQELGQRPNQEDSIYPAIGETIPDNDLFILCDGMGGHEAGEVASQAVCKVMSDYILRHPDTDFESALNAAYDALDELDTDSVRKMGTTMTFVKFDTNGCIAAHIGDSRIYQIRPSEKKIVFVTKDHSLVNDLIACGEMTPEEAKHSNQKNVITRAMQPHQDRRAKADVSILTDVRPGDYFYMCSDGMLEISEDADIVNVFSLGKSDEQKLEILRGVTRDNKDNHTAHLIHVISVEGGTAHRKKVITLPKLRLKKRVSLKKILAAIVISVLVAVAILFFLRQVKLRGSSSGSGGNDPIEMTKTEAPPEPTDT